MKKIIKKLIGLIIICIIFGAIATVSILTCGWVITLAAFGIAFIICGLAVIAAMLLCGD